MSYWYVRHSAKCKIKEWEKMKICLCFTGYNPTAGYDINNLRENIFASPLSDKRPVSKMYVELYNSIILIQLIQLRWAEDLTRHLCGEA